MKRELELYRGKEIFIDVDMPKEDFKGNITAKDKGKFKKVWVDLYVPEVGSRRITIIDGYVDPEIKEFLETGEFIGFYTEYDMKLMFTLGIVLDIKHDVRKLIATEDRDRLRKSYSKREFVTIGIQDKSEAELTAHIYEKYKHNIETELYSSMMSFTRMTAKGDYFGIGNDFNVDKHNTYCESIAEELKELASQIKTKYGFDANNITQINQWLKDTYEIELYRPTISDISELTATYPELGDVIKAIKNYRQRRRYYAILKKANNNITEIISRYNINSRSKVLYLKDELDIFDTDSKKYYYVSIKAPLIQSKYVEKRINNIEINTDTYIEETAKKIFNKEEITISEYKQAKLYNFCRTVMADPTTYSATGKYVDSTLKRSNIANILDVVKQRVPLYNTQDEILIDLNKLVLSKFITLEKEFKENNRFDVTLNYIDFGDTFVFKVSNKINPYRAMRKIYESLDTTAEIGTDLFTELKVFNSYKDFKTFDIISKDQVYEGFNSIKEEKVRDVVKHVYKGTK